MYKPTSGVQLGRELHDPLLILILFLQNWMNVKLNTMIAMNLQHAQSIITLTTMNATVSLVFKADGKQLASVMHGAGSVMVIRILNHFSIYSLDTWHVISKGKNSLATLKCMTEARSTSKQCLCCLHTHT